MNLRIFLIPVVALIGLLSADAEQLIILHTNDTHSQIDPTDKDLGGVLRRKALIDSVRSEHDNVLLIDAGDVVQGTLYFSLYGGEVECKVMNHLGYDIQVLGNHEFDNGIEAIAKQWSQLKATKLTTNYDLRTTPLGSIFKPFAIKEFAGVKVGFLAINLDPKGMIDDKNVVGIKYIDGIKAANSMAWYLRHVEHADLVVAITHVGYDNVAPPTPNDLEIARCSEDIDLIIGGHSHTELNGAGGSPAFRVPNAVGDTILLAQAGKQGRNVGEIVVDMKSLTMESRLLKVDKRYDDKVDMKLVELLEPYRFGVDSLMSVNIGRTSRELPQDCDALSNWIADALMSVGDEMTDRPLDFAIINKGGIRRGLPKGNITKGIIMTMLPFDNRTVVLEIKGDALASAFDVMASRGGDGVSQDVAVKYDKNSGKCNSVLIDGKPLDPERIYRVVTIDYLANGGDYMTSMRSGKVVNKKENVLYDDIIDYIERLRGKKINPTDEKRMIAE